MGIPAGQGSGCGHGGAARPQGADLTVALFGNPNTGKSTLFNALTGLRQHVGNWPGKTVERAEGVCQHAGLRLEVVDLPGAYGLYADTPEEQIAAEYLRSGAADAVIQVVDATNLERNLYLLLLTLELTPRVVVGLNMMDAARARGLRVDADALSRALGVPVVPLAAARGEGLEQLLTAAVAVARGEAVVRSVAGWRDRRVAVAPTAEERQEGAARLYRRAQGLARRVVRQEGPTGPDLTERLDRVVTSRWLAFPLMMCLLGVVFWITMFGATPVSNALTVFFDGLARTVRQGLTAASAPPWLVAPLVDGLIVGVGAVVSVMLPTMAIFFILFALVEDAGFIPRIAFNMDRLMQPVGSEGKHCLTCLMAYGCNIPGVMSARILSGPYRLIAILTNALNPCNGRLGPMLALSALFFGSRGAVVMVGLLTLSMGTVLAGSFLLSRTLLRGQRGAFVMELPPYRRPTLVRVLATLKDRVWGTLWRASAVAAPVTVLIWFLANFPRGAAPGDTLAGRLAAALDPVGGFLGLDGSALAALLFALPAKEIIIASLAITNGLGASLGGAAGLDQALLARWTPFEAFSFLAFYMLYLPCTYTWVAIYKETGSLRWTAVGLFLPLGLAVAVALFLRGAGAALGWA